MACRSKQRIEEFLTATQDTLTVFDEIKDNKAKTACLDSKIAIEAKQ